MDTLLAAGPPIDTRPEDFSMRSPGSKHRERQAYTQNSHTTDAVEGFCCVTICGQPARSWRSAAGNPRCHSEELVGWAVSLENPPAAP